MAYRRQDGDVEDETSRDGQPGIGECENECEEVSFGLAEKM
jgi:hypothetical protein